MTTTDQDVRLPAPDDAPVHGDGPTRTDGGQIQRPARGGGPWIGRPLRRVEDERILRGKGRFVDDNLPSGCLHVAFLRSPHARARIVALRTATAEGAAGVVLVATGEDLAGIGSPPVNPVVPGMDAPRFAVLAVDEACAVGEAVAAVVAESLDAARDATELIEVEFEPIDAVTRPEIAATAAPVLPDVAANEMLVQRWRNGDVEGAFAAAAASAEIRIAQPRLSAVARFESQRERHSAMTTMNSR